MAKDSFVSVLYQMSEFIVHWLSCQWTVPKIEMEMITSDYILNFNGEITMATLVGLWNAMIKKNGDYEYDNTK